MRERIIEGRRRRRRRQDLCQALFRERRQRHYVRRLRLNQGTGIIEGSQRCTKTEEPVESTQAMLIELDAGSSAELGESFPQEGPRTSLPRLAVETTLRAFDLR